MNQLLLEIGIIYSFFNKKNGRDSGYEAVFYGLIAGYWIGFPSGVYLAASGQNPNLSYWITLGVSSGLILLTAGISYLFFPNDNDHPTRWAALFMPIVSSLLYVNFFTPDQINKNNLEPLGFEVNNFRTHKDFFNSQVSFRMEILRVYF